MKTEVRCPNCGTSFVIGNGESVPMQLHDGISYLVPETIRNENKTNQRLDILKAAGINVDKLKDLMDTDASIKDIFCEDDPIVKELTNGGFINNPELFRRWITAQTFRLLNDRRGWTKAVRERFDLRYIYEMCMNELKVLCKLQRERRGDVRLNFFTLCDMKIIFKELMRFNLKYSHTAYLETTIASIMDADSYCKLWEVVSNIKFRFNKNCTYKPKTWLNCFKGAGAYYTLQNIIRTHGLILPDCEDMKESLKVVDVVFKDIIGYDPMFRRWDILLSLLTSAIHKTNFELKY